MLLDKYMQKLLFFYMDCSIRKAQNKNLKQYNNVFCEKLWMAFDKRKQLLMLTKRETIYYNTSITVIILVLSFLS